MKSLAFTDEYGERHIIFAWTDEAIEAIQTLCEVDGLDFEIDPEDA